MTDSPQIEIARINAKQAIIVALITAFASILVTMISQPLWKKAPQPISQWYIAINKIEILESSAINEPSPPVRVIPIVNNQAYSFPSRNLWIRTDGQVSGEEFPLPQITDRVAVRFDALVRRNYQIGQLTSQEVQSYKITQLPIKGVYDLIGIDDTSVRGGAGSTRIRVTYEIKRNSA